MGKSGQEIVNSSFVLDACTYVEFGFKGCHEIIHNSGLDAFFLTTPYSPIGFQDTVRSMGAIYRLCDKPETKVKIIRSIGDLAVAKSEGKLGLIFAFQDPKPIENSLDNLRILYEMGLRVVQMSYMLTNFIGSGCCETHDAGLTDFGYEVLGELNRLGIIVDIAHCGTKTSLDTLKSSKAPVNITHANPRALSDNCRNHTDEELKLIAETGGVVGVCPWGPIAWKPHLRHQPTMEEFLEIVDYVVKLVGIDHIGYGTDYILDEGDNMSEKTAGLYPQVAKLYNDTHGLDNSTRFVKGFKGSPEIVNVADELLKHGYKEGEIEKFLGGNWLRVMKEVWK